MSSILSAMSDLGLSPDSSVEDFDESEHHSEENHVFVKGLNDFAFKLYKEENKTKGNVIVSPINTAICLVIAWSASNGKTAKELAATLQLSSMDTKQAISGMNGVLEILLAAKRVYLCLANKLYTNRGVPIKKSFRKFCTKKFRTDIEEVEFTVPDSARRTINQAMEKRTKGVYKEYLAPYNINENTKLLFVSATYFKAGWFKSFNESATKKGPFKIAEGKAVEVDMFHGSFQLKYHIIELLDAKGITLTFWDDRFQMVLILPNSPAGFSKMQEKLETLELRDLSFSLRAVNVTVPRFKIEKAYQMKSVLTKIGLQEIFQKSAELPNLASEPTYIEDFFSKIVFGITEHGTCEDAKSGESKQSKIPSQPVDFTADRPFVFIVKKESDIIFLGRVVNPTPTSL